MFWILWIWIQATTAIAEITDLSSFYNQSYFIFTHTQNSSSPSRLYNRQLHGSETTRYDAQYSPTGILLALSERTVSLMDVTDKVDRNRTTTVMDRLMADVKPTSSATPFVLSFTCSANSQRCSLAKRGFVRALRKVSKTLEIRESIRIDARFVSFCQVHSLCGSDTKTLGQAGATTYFGTDVMPDGRTLLFPQSLVKQFNLRQQPVWNDFDILAEFNADVDFYFREDSEESVNIAAVQYDFEYVVLHEILHGFGFASALRPHLADGLVTPIPQLSRTAPELRGWMPIFVYDYFLEDTQTGIPLRQYADIISEFKSEQPLILSMAELATSMEGAYARDLHTITTTPSRIVFHIPQKTDEYRERANEISQVLMETSYKPFASGSTLSHIDFQYSDSPDFLMRAKAQNGITLQELTRRYGSRPIGPRTAAMLNSLGWRLRKNVLSPTRDRTHHHSKGSPDRNSGVSNACVRLVSTTSRVVGFVTIVLLSWIV